MSVDPHTGPGLPPLPDLIITNNDDWVRVNATAAVSVWAAETAAEMIASHRQGEQDPQTLPVLLEKAATVALRADTSLAYLLMPMPRRQLVTAARFVWVLLDEEPDDLTAPNDDADVRQMVVRAFLAGDQELMQPAEWGDFDTPVGMASWVRTRSVSADRAVTETLSLAWVFPDTGWGMMLVVPFADLTDAGRYVRQVLTLAAGVRWRTGCEPS